MSILGVIPARFASSRLPGKPLELIGGKSMIRRVYERCRLALDEHQLCIATDDMRIFDHAKSFTDSVCMTSTEHVNGTERVAEVVSKLGFEGVVINIQGDEPFIDPAAITQVISAFEDARTDISSLYRCTSDTSEISKDSVIKTVIDNRGFAMYFSRSVIPFQKDLSSPLHCLRHIGIYGFRSDVLLQIVKLPASKLELLESLEQLRWLENGYSIKMTETSHISESVDTFDDLFRIREKWEQNKF